MITYKQGDLFLANDNLCHCVSADMHMGKGIAVEFKKRFGKPQLSTSQVCWSVGDVAIIEKDEYKILYLVTKEKYWQKPTYEALQLCIDKISQLQLKTLSMPKIGCGLDGLQWRVVSSMLEKTMQNTDITVYSL